MRFWLMVSRKQNGLTQEQLAEKVGTSVKSVSDWENGKSSPGSLRVWGKLCEALGITIEKAMEHERETEAAK